MNIVIEIQKLHPKEHKDYNPFDSFPAECKDHCLCIFNGKGGLTMQHIYMQKNFFISRYVFRIMFFVL